MEAVPYHVHDGMDSPKIKQTKVKGVYTESELVKLTTDQSVAGIKTFTSIPVLPASDPTTANQAVRKAYLDGLIPGYEVVPGTVTRDNGTNGGPHTLADWTLKSTITHNDVDGRIKVYIQIHGNGGAGSARLVQNSTTIAEVSATNGNYAEIDTELDIETGDNIKLYLNGMPWNDSFVTKYDKVFNVIAGTVTGS